MPLNAQLRELAGEAALQLMKDGEARAAQAGPREAQARTSSNPGDVGESTQLILRASKSMVALESHYRQLEAYARDREQWASEEIRRLEDEAAQWEQATTEAERQFQDTERQLALLAERAASADQSAEQDRKTLKALQEHLQTSFGSGSDAFRIMSELQ